MTRFRYRRRWTRWGPRIDFQRRRFGIFWKTFEVWHLDVCEDLVHTEVMAQKHVEELNDAHRLGRT